MGDERRSCPACGSSNRVEALWCAMCHERFEGVVAPPPPPPSTVPGRPALAMAVGSPGPPVPAPIDVGWLSGMPPAMRWGIKVALYLLPVLVVAALIGGRAQISMLDRMGLGRAQPVAGGYDSRGFQPLLVDPETNEPVRYGCAPVRYVINPTHAPEGGVEDVQRAIAETSKASGIRFVYAGETDETPMQGRPVHQDRYGDGWAPILIAWDLGPIPVPGQVSPVGVGGSDWRYNEDDAPVFVTGTLILNANAGLRSGFGGETWGQVMLHELGHVVGLAHVSDPQQVMTPVLELRPAAWGSGDRAGLRAVGIASSCLDVPDVS